MRQTKECAAAFHKMKGYGGVIEQKLIINAAELNLKAALFCSIFKLVQSFIASPVSIRHLAAPDYSGEHLAGAVTTRAAVGSTVYAIRVTIPSKSKVIDSAASTASQPFTVSCHDLV